MSPCLQVESLWLSQVPHPTDGKLQGFTSSPSQQEMALEWQIANSSMSRAKATVLVPGVSPGLTDLLPSVSEVTVGEEFAAATPNFQTRWVWSPAHQPLRTPASQSFLKQLRLQLWKLVFRLTKPLWLPPHETLGRKVLYFSGSLYAGRTSSTNV